MSQSIPLLAEELLNCPPVDSSYLTYIFLSAYLTVRSKKLHLSITYTFPSLLFFLRIIVTFLRLLELPEEARRVAGENVELGTEDGNGTFDYYID